jgi:uncharacterized membrane protein HdeD (DUF308 family)
LLLMSELFSYLSIPLHTSMVIAGILAIVSLFSAKKTRASNRKIKIVLIVILGVLIILAIALVAAAKYA